MASTVDLLRRVLEEDPSSEEALELALFLLQDPTSKDQLEEAFDTLRKEGFEEQLQTFQEQSLGTAEEFVRSGVVSDTQPTPEGPPETQFDMGRTVSTALIAATGSTSIGRALAAKGIKMTPAIAKKVFQFYKRNPEGMMGGRLAQGAKILGTGAAAQGILMQGEAFSEPGGQPVDPTLQPPDADPGTGGDHNAASPDPFQAPTEQTAPMYIQDPQSGQMIPITPEDMGPEFTTGADPFTVGQEPSFGPGLSATEFMAAEIARGQGQSGIGAQGPTPDPRALGTMQVENTFKMPSVASVARPPGMQPLAPDPAASGSSAGEGGRPSTAPSNIFTQTFGGSPDARLSRMPEEPVPGESVLGPMEVPAGAQIDNRAFQQFQGRTLLDWAREAAARYRVPMNVLYGLVSLESGWDPNAVGDHGSSFGLVQIHRPAFPNISRSQAMDPKFALDFAARQLRDRYDKYGRWDAAVAAHNSPVAANYLAETGQFYNDKSQSYTSAVMQRAQSSGLSSMQVGEFDSSGGLFGIESAGVGTSMGGEGAVFPVEGGTLPGASQIGNPRDGGARSHQGLDIDGPEGATVYATTGGKVRYASNRGGKGGYAVSIEDAQGNWHYYAHLSPTSAQLWQSQGITEGAQVNAGSVIGYVGSTGNAQGPHLHYSINEGRKNAPLIDPWDWLQGSNMAPEPEFQPFQRPDIATSKDFIRSIYTDLLGREPTEGELGMGSDSLEAMTRENYNRSIQAARGLETQAVDPQARFEEELRGSGEFEFAQERTNLRSFSDYAANIARMLQQGL